MMNIFYLHCHDAGRHLSPYDHPVKTPCLEQFATEALCFDQAYCVAPTCSPSRTALLTGVYPHQAGVLGLAHRGFALPDGSRHLAWVLRGIGYETVLAGVQHEFRHDDPSLPYERVLSPPLPAGCTLTERDRGIAQVAAEFLKKRKDDRPLFLSCGFFLPHRPFPEPESTPPESGEPRLHPLPDHPEVRRDYAAYGQAAFNMDAAFGLVREAIRNSGLEENSVILFTTDHGIAFPGMKCNLTDAGLGVALLLKTPDLAKPGTHTDSMVCHLDLYPTLLGYAGLPPSVATEGIDLRPFLRGESDATRSEFFAEVTYHAAYEPKRAIRTADWKYIRNYELEHHPAMANIDEGPARIWMRQEGLLPGPATPAEELYDLRSDPHEACNRAAEPGCREVISTLRNKLDAWMERTEDPLRRGHVPAPPEAIVAPPGSWFP